jgi:hypothetical protein
MFDGMTMEGLRDAVQILMCGVILACVACNRLKSLRREELRPAPPAAFSDEVMLQSLRQQTEQALTAIQGAVQAERLRLERLMSPVDPLGAPSAPDPEPVDLTPFRLGDPPPTGGGSRYDVLPGLAASGLTPRELSAQTQLPAGEIELALKLRRSMAEQGRRNG